MADHLMLHNCEEGVMEMKTRSGVRRGGAILAAMGVVMALQSSRVDAGDCSCSICTGCGPAYQLVERTIEVPTLVTERRTIQVTECRPEQRQRTVMVSRSVPETRQVTETFTVMVPEVRVRTETYHVRVPVWREVDRRVVIQVPHQEQRQGTRNVCHQVQVEELRTVHRDLGHYEEVLCDGGCAPAMGCSPCYRRRLFGCGRCGGCGGCGGYAAGCGYDAGCGGGVAQHTHQVWRPNVVTEQVPVTVWRNQMVQEPYEYTVTVYRPEERVQRVKVCEYVTEERSRDVQFTVCVPTQQTRTRNVTTYRVVTEPRVENYVVQVPHVVSREVDVMVCRMVPRTVVCREPVGQPAGWQSYGCGAGDCGVGWGGCWSCARGCW
jgi:hypothetical protein